VSVAERAYTYAKSRGIIGKSFIEKRTGKLSTVTSLNELEQLIFSNIPPESPASGSIDAIEIKIMKRSSKAILSVLGAFRKTPEILVLLARSYEYADLKRFIAALNDGRAPAPPWTPLGKFSTVDFSAYPDLGAMLRGSEFEFLGDVQSGAGGNKNKKIMKELSGAGRNGAEINDMNVLLDRLYYKKLLEATAKIPKNDFSGGRHLFFEEISLLNCALAMRLRFYYEMRADDIKMRLIDGKLTRNGRSLSADAMMSLSMKIDHRADWQNWRRRNFLHDEEGGKYWKCDPRRFQTAASIYLYKLALRYFRSRPFSLDTACCFIRLKQFEEQLLTGIAEGTKLGMNVRDVLKTLGAEL
jgi:vacuolar-type H+-ATPase subunit C/Vma6